jgi:peptidoglycan/LPS O-acetylase OafA/YrhL
MTVTTTAHREAPRARAAGPRLTYLPGLDGMRALAVAAVIVYHADKTWLPGGFLGVEVFFVISGYLITMLLVAERQRSGHVDLRQFWFRRFRRLLPALFVMMAGVALWVSLFERDELGQLRGDLVAGTAYAMNWFQIWTGSSYFSSFEMVPLRHLWSLAVEEQYYVVWPLVMVAVLKVGRSRLPKVAWWFLGTALASSVLMAITFRSGPVIDPEQTPGQFVEVLGRSISRLDLAYLSTFTRASGLLLGAALALLWQPWALARAPIARKAGVTDAVGVVGLVALAAMTYVFHDVVITEEGTRGYDLLYRGGFLLVGLATLVVIMAVTHPRTRLGGRVALGNPVLSWIGTRSYGLYLYHWPIFQLTRKVAGKPLTPLEFVLLTALTVVVAEASFRLIETPIRQGHLGAWWDRVRSADDAAAFATRRRMLGAGVVVTMLGAFTLVSVATAEVRPNEIRESVEAGREATTDLLGEASGVGATPPPNGTSPDATSPTDTVPGETVPGETVPGETVPATVAPTTEPPTTPPPQPIDVVAIGDSVMLGAAPNLRARGYVVDAAESRQFKAAIDIAKYLNESGQLGNVAIVHLGTNGPVSQSTLDEVFTWLRPVPLVVVLTVRVTKDWQNPNNELIRDLPRQWPNVKVLDWYADTENKGDWFYSDRTHLRPEGAEGYAQLIAQAIGRA